MSKHRYIKTNYISIFVHINPVIMTYLSRSEPADEEVSAESSVRGVRHIVVEFEYKDTGENLFVYLSIYMNKLIAIPLPQ